MEWVGEVSGVLVEVTTLLIYGDVQICAKYTLSNELCSYNHPYSQAWAQA